MNYTNSSPLERFKLGLAVLTFVSLVATPAPEAHGGGTLRSVTYRGTLAPGEPLQITLVMYNSGGLAWESWLRRVDWESWESLPYVTTVTERIWVFPGETHTATITRAGLPTTPGTYSLRLRVYDYTGGMYAYELDNSPVNVTFTIASVSPPAITEHPMDVTVWVGGQATFRAMADGYPEPVVQWQVAASPDAPFVDLAGATKNILTFAARLADHGQRYRAVFANAHGSQSSVAATLTVHEPPVLAVRREAGADGSAPFGLTLRGPVGWEVVVEASTDLRDWSPVSTNVCAQASLDLSDPESVNLPQRFYRVRTE